MIKKTFLCAFISLGVSSLFATTTTNEIANKSIKRCKKQNELLNSFDKDFIHDIINSKAGDFKDLKDENRKDKMKECE